MNVAAAMTLDMCSGERYDIRGEGRPAPLPIARWMRVVVEGA